MRKSEPLLPILIWVFISSVILFMGVRWATGGIRSNISATSLTSEMDRPDSANSQKED